MGKLGFYIVRNIFVTTLLVLFIVFGIYFVFTFIAQLGDIGQGSYGVWGAVKTVLYSIPWSLNLMFPIIAMLGTLMGLSMLAQSGELVAMRASGVSWYLIFKAVLFMGVIFAIISFIIGSYLAPKLNVLSMTEQQFAQQGENLYIGQKSLWLKDKNNFFYIEEMESGYHGILEGVTRYHIENGVLLSVLKAKRAIFKDHHWVLYNVSESKINSNNYKTQKHDQVTLDAFISPKLIKLLSDSSSIENLSLHQLDLVIDYRIKNNLRVAAFQMAFWRIIFQPISIIILMFSVLPYIFMANARRAYAVRLLVGGAVGFAFFVFNQFFSQIFIVYDFSIPAFIIAALPCLCFLLITLLLVRIQKNV